MKQFQLIVISLFFFLSFTSQSCKEGDKTEATPLNPKTKEFFDFNENTTWQYIVNDNPDSTEEFVLKNKALFIRDLDNSENITYNLNLNGNTFMTYRAESGPSNFSNRNTFIVHKNGSQIISAFLWFQGQEAYCEEVDTLEKLNNYSQNGITYELAYKLLTKRNGEIKELIVAKGSGIIFIKFKDNKTLTLKELKK
jgi:hypothetical protein